MGAELNVAQVNIGKIKGPIGSEVMADFVAGLEHVNAIADARPGFVWRLQTEEGDATSLQPYPDPLVIVNMSVWSSIDALWDFVYSGDHLAYMRRRREWFTRMENFQCLWWVPAGHTPTVEEAKERLAILAERGPSPEAFTFKRRFPAPDETASAVSGDSA